MLPTMIGFGSSSRNSFWILAPVAVFLGGCATIRPADDARRDVVLERYFTPRAAAVLGAVPLRYGEIQGFCGLAVGNDWGSRTAGVLLGFGNRRQVVLGIDCDDFAAFHEYVHQAQYSGLINTALFRQRYALLRRDPRYGRLARRWEHFILEQYGQSPALLALAYGRGVTRELIAYLIQGWVERRFELPDYFLDVYRETVRLSSPP